MVVETPRAAVRAWRDGLVNLDASNRLLNFRPTASGTLEIAGPAAPDIVSALRGDRDYGFLPAGARPEPGGLFRTGLTAVALGAQLRRLQRKTRQDFLDRGVAALHLAIGMLHWRDEEDVALTSPILLLPGELVTQGPADVPRLRVRGEDPVVNPALALRLRRMGITMPGVDGLAGLDVREYVASLRSCVDNRDWAVEETVLLSRFTFHKEAMYRDLLDNEARIVAHPLVEALAGRAGVVGGTGGAVGEPVDARRGGPVDVAGSGDPIRGGDGGAFGGGNEGALAGRNGSALGGGNGGVLAGGSGGALAGRNGGALGGGSGGALGGGSGGALGGGSGGALAGRSGGALGGGDGGALGGGDGGASSGRTGAESACGQPAQPHLTAVSSSGISPGGRRGGGWEPRESYTSEDLPLVLDADATQRACVEAALAGQSFVLDGPPGTGKSQTIANLIGCLLHAGKRILFVSEKAAALEVVRNRLAAVGLDPYLLELHSHKATRKEVARALATSLEPRVIEPAAQHDQERLDELRDLLNGYATAMNERREPLGRTLHEVLGDCARLTELPEVPVPCERPRELTPQAIHDALEAADDLTRCRRAAAEPKTFPWRGVVERAPLGETLRRAQSALHALAGAARQHTTIAEAFGATRPAQAGTLAMLVTHAARRPSAVADDWLTAPSLEPIGRAAERRSRRLADARRARAAVREAAGVEWHELPDLDPPAIEPPTLTAAGAEETVRRLAGEADALDELRAEAAATVARLGLPAVVTFADLTRFAELAELAARPHRPEPFWFGPGVLAGVSVAAAALRRCTEAVTAAEAECRRWFRDGIVEQPVEQLADRLAHEHRGLRKLLGAYRRDWDAVAAHAHASVSPAEAVAHVGAAVAWQRALRERAAAEQQYGPLLGRYWRGDAPLHEALHLAGEIMRRTPPDALPAVADQLCRPVPDPRLARTAARVRALARRESAADTPQDAAARRRDRLGPLLEVAAALHAFARALGRDAGLEEARQLARLRRVAADEERVLADDYATAVAGLGVAAVHDDALEEAVMWARAARRLTSGIDRPLTGEQAAALHSDGGAAALTERFGAWEDARDAVVAAFAPERRAEVGELTDDYDGALLTGLLDDPGGQDQWLGYDRARRVLTTEAIAVSAGVPDDQVRPALHRALLAAWADAVIRDDDRLHPIGGLERDRLVEEFRGLDAALSGQAPATIAAAVEQRRAAARVPAEVMLLRREGMKETRHLAVRDLIGRTRQTVQSGKPCFLMSPLAVSQFLPADLEFDVVVFDEASQIAPADAINCLYRASAVIVAGDDRQLPPTSFFTRTDTDADGSDVNDFQSILELAKGCGKFPVRGLGWHYRSRHEALIAFANNQFYEGRLRTFPGANADPETGVELIPARGVYRRGTKRDNPVEAEMVAERIVSCLTTRPELSYGVVTFSVAQAEAIEAALDRATVRHPGLDRLLDGDRLSGFFVKSLESVQGDERDVMIFSIGYGRDEQGRITTHFGALNQANGWRRLNVAITRARRRVEIISSVRARDIPESANEGVRHLAAYLDYAERGAAALPGRLPATDPFVASVLETVCSWGYRARARIGLDGYRVDVGVRHPTPAGGYILGIECDGPRYGSIGSARDRDRLAGEVLTGLGWQLHRVWGAAWHRDRAGEEARLRKAIERAIGSLPSAGPRPYRRVESLGLRLVP
ncbi:DUF4011 domain-containing protein [Paractinoplanes lichenicola]|uniref:DUF4011 domain-containing protein n=1 Tax=Paractinoplanes lichenicola TaxID=2802976 RepID=A0ABS1VXM4_9ACTN|nr:DUF4011 domain-containing protein [Actinoplanes lichenicola]MBL7259197.1 DUF4011 domain-containing protein [Actinoplanes lichenicola]